MSYLDLYLFLALNDKVSYFFWIFNHLRDYLVTTLLSTYQRLIPKILYPIMDLWSCLFTPILR